MAEFTKLQDVIHGGGVFANRKRNVFSMIGMSTLESRESSIVIHLIKTMRFRTDGRDHCITIAYSVPSSTASGFVLN